MTSQILANIYFNEFDRFVRHTLRPFAYIRYGDDFVLFVGSKIETKQIQDRATGGSVKTLSYGFIAKITL